MCYTKSVCQEVIIRKAVIMKYKVLVLDIDGTLTNTKKEITYRTKSAITRIMEQGVTVVLASGRPISGIEPIARELELDKYNGYILAFNGARIIECSNKKIIHDQTLSRDMILKLYDLSKLYNVSILSYDKDSIVTEMPNDEYVNIEARINKMPIKEVENFKEYVDYPVNKCLMVGEGEYLAKVEEEVREKVKGEISVYRSEPYFLECVPLNIDKAASLEKLLEYIHCTKDEMIACGDGYNDISMIKYAGLGVAMENAREEVKEVADILTLSNDEDGVAHIIDKFFL